MRSVIATTVSFGKYSVVPAQMMEEKGFEIIRDIGLKSISELSETEKLSVEAIIVGLEKINAEVMNSFPNLKVIAKHGAGTDNIDLIAAKERNIKVFNVPGANSNAVADLAFGLMISVSRMIAKADRLIRGGGWEKFYGVELGGKTLSIIGFGSVGKAVARRGMGFGMDVLVYDVVKSDFDGVQFVDFEEAVKRADYLTVHAPLIDSTKHLINGKIISQMKKTAYIINTARGGLIDETALLDALENGDIAGAGLDVFENEGKINPRFLKLDNVVLTPHIAGFSQEAINEISMRCAEYILECCAKHD